MDVSKSVGAEPSRESLEKLLCDEIADLLHAENMLVKALPKMVTGANAAELKDLFGRHLIETREHSKRLETMFGLLGLPAREKKCEAMMGLLVECQHLLTRAKPSPATDQVLVCAARKIEAFEIVAYDSVAAWASYCGHDKIGALAQATMREEQAMLTEYEKLTVEPPPKPRAAAKNTKGR
jgi:ferritin-like metal-binding protein YciE